MQERATTFAIAIVKRAITLVRAIKKKKQRTDTINKVKKIKSNKFISAIEKNQYGYRNIGKMNNWMAP